MGLCCELYSSSYKLGHCSLKLLVRGPRTAYFVSNHGPWDLKPKVANLKNFTVGIYTATKLFPPAN